MDRAFAFLLLALVASVSASEPDHIAAPPAAAPCPAASIAAQAIAACVPNAATAAPPAVPSVACCEPVVGAVDVGGGVACLCRVATEPLLGVVGLNASRLLALYSACGGAAVGGADLAHLAAICEGNAASGAVAAAPGPEAEPERHRPRPSPRPKPPPAPRHHPHRHLPAPYNGGPAPALAPCSSAASPHYSAVYSSLGLTLQATQLLFAAFLALVLSV